MKKMSIKKVIKMVLLLVAAILIYLVVGAVAPFLHIKQMEHTDKPNQLVEQVMTKRESPDRAMIVETNQSALEERIRLIHMAKKNIVLTTFDMREGESTSDILAMLYQKAEEGVHVQILVDGLSGFLRMKGSSLFHAVANHKNIEIKLYNTINPILPWKSMGRMHDKYLIIDDMGYLLGGRNSFDYFIGEYDSDGKSLDREVLVYNTKPGEKDSSICELYDYFHKLWNSDLCADFTGSVSDKEKNEYKEFLSQRYQKLQEQYPQLFTEYDYTAVTKRTDGVTLLSNDTHIYSKEPVLYYELTSLMKRAKSKVVIHTPYAVMNDYMLDSLRSICVEVPVTMMVNARENGDNVVASSDYTYRRSQIADTKVKLLEYVGGPSYHGKSVVIDDNIAIVGSFNFDMRSTYVDTELMVAVNSKEVTAELTNCMEQLHADCRDFSQNKEENISIGKKVVFRSLGLIMQAFRVFV